MSIITERTICQFRNFCSRYNKVRLFFTDRVSSTDFVRSPQLTLLGLRSPSLTTEKNLTKDVYEVTGIINPPFFFVLL